MIPGVEDIRNTLQLWEARIKEAREMADARLERVLKSLAQGTRENGRVIFSREGLDGVASEVTTANVFPAIEDLLRQDLGQTQLDLLSLGPMEPGRIGDLVYGAAYRWVLSPACPIDLRTVTLYSKFVEAYPDAERRQGILKETEALSAVFL